MTQKALWRAFKYSSICLTAILLVLFTPNITNALVANNAPVISSNPTLVVTTDQTYQYSLLATDSDNNTISFKLTNSPVGATLNGDTISWSPKITGMYNMVVEASDGNNGYDNQVWQISVTAGEAASIVVTPNNKPTNINIGGAQQFTAIAFDAAGNTVTDAKFKWITDGIYTSVNTSGLVTAESAGIGYITASIGDIEASPGIVVHDNTISLIAEPTTLIEDEEEKVEEVIEDLPEETENINEESLNDDTEEAELMTLESNEEANDNNEDENKEDEECINIVHGLTFTFLIIYTLILAIYFIYEKKHKSTNWWIFPLLVTFIGLIVYYRYFCPQTYLWWPWILVVIGILTTGYYKGRSSTPTEDNPGNELPF